MCAYVSCACTHVCTHVCPHTLRGYARQVSGGPMGAKLGKLTAIVGGDAKAVRPVPSVAGDAVARGRTSASAECFGRCWRVGAARRALHGIRLCCGSRRAGGARAAAPCALRVIDRARGRLRRRPRGEGMHGTAWAPTGRPPGLPPSLAVAVLSFVSGCPVVSRRHAKSQSQLLVSCQRCT